MLISGRVHAAVAGLSQNIPTTIIDYGHEPKAHKLMGFAEVAGVRDYVANPSDLKDMKEKVEKCWTKREEIRSFLKGRNIVIRSKITKQFDLLKTIFDKEDRDVYF
jgi:colanic acid/amylovoran biosynthesis protein